MINISAAAFLKALPQQLESVKTRICAFSFPPTTTTEPYFTQKIENFLKLIDFCCDLLNSLSHVCLLQFRSSSSFSTPNLMSQVEAIHGIAQTVLPSFIESVWRSFGGEAGDAKLALVPGKFAGALVVARSKLMQASMKFLSIYYKSSSSSSSVDFVNDEKRMQLICENLNNKEFLIRLDDEINIEGELAKFLANSVCTEQQVESALKAIKQAYAQRARQIKRAVGRQRIFQFLGFPKEKQISDQIQELAEIIPDLSNQQLHLCLRHFGYDIEKTIMALCQREQLPLDLRILVRTKDTLLDDDAGEEENEFGGGPRRAFVCDDGIAGMSADLYFNETLTSFTLQAVDDLVEKVAADEATVQLNGKLLVPVVAASEKSPTKEERKALTAASIRLAAQIDEEDEKQQQLLAGDDAYDDEYDDSFEHAQLYTGVDIAANVTLDESIETLEEESPANEEASPNVGGRTHEKAAKSAEKTFKNGSNIKRGGRAQRR